MEGMRNSKAGSHWIFTFLCALLLSASASAGLLNWREDDGATATVEATAAASDVTPASSSAVPTEPAATTPAEASAAPTVTAATPASNGTEAANSTTPAAAAASSEFSKPLNASNDPHECHVTPLIGGSGNPFCKPYLGQTFLVGKEYAVTWDESLFASNSTNTILLQFLIDLGSDSTDNVTTLQQTKVPNTEGTVFLTMNSDWLNKSSSANLSLSLKNDQAEGVLPGPIITLKESNSTSNKPHSAASDKAKKLGEAVGIPMGLVFLIVVVALIAAFICLRKRRGLGYGGGKAARSQRMEAAAAAPVASRGHRRDASFHDEPTRGMELQDRNRGLTGEDNWDWGSPVSSPTTGGRNSNAFRDELQRQRSGRRS